MPKSLKAALLALIAAALTTAALSADPTPMRGLSAWKLTNGLEVFALENRNAPMVRIQITFRCGAIAQSEDTAGLFHLYEHMLFKGNSQYPSEAAFHAAMTALGVANWNGGTSTEYVTYYFTIPSSKLEAGLEFWSYAMRAPLLDAKELELEKDVVVNEIKGAMGEPDTVFGAGMDKKLFAKYPWRRDILGSEASIRAATVEKLRAIQAAYYVPNNCAVLVGGDLAPEATRALVDKWFGGWAKAADPWAKPAPAHPFMTRATMLAYSDEAMYPGFASVAVRYKGPDVVSDPVSTYAADVWGLLIANPAGKFKSDIFKAVDGLYQKDYISGFYWTQRDGGQILFDTYMLAGPKYKSVAERALYFKEAVKAELTAMLEDPKYFAKEELEAVKQKLEDEQEYLLETPEAFLETLSFWWSSASTDYYFNYIPNMKKVTVDSIRAFLLKYALKHEAVIGIRLDPDEFAAEKKPMESFRYDVIVPEKAFWWAK